MTVRVRARANEKVQAEILKMKSKNASYNFNPCLLDIMKYFLETCVPASLQLEFCSIC